MQNDNVRSGIHTEDVDINDLPQMLRNKCQGKDFVQQAIELCGSHVQISVKGTHIETGKTPGPGQKRLHLMVEASSKQEAQLAYKEVRRIVDDLVQ